MVISSLRVHDLLRTLKTVGFRFDDSAPSWAVSRATSSPWVVARRARAESGWHAAGLRGLERCERCALWVHESAIAEVIAPEDLAAGGPAIAPRRDNLALPALRALPAVATIMQDCLDAASWGPTGSVGLELASGQPWVTESSDLDVMVRAQAPLARRLARTLHRCLSQLQPRVDVLIETPLGGVALADWT